MKQHQRGMTIVEVLIAASLLTLVLGMVWQLWRIVNSSKGNSFEDLAQRTMLNQEAVIGLEKLYNRLQEGIEIIEPKPGVTSKKMVFRDILNHSVTLELVDASAGRTGTLVSRCKENDNIIEKGKGCPANEFSDNKEFFPAPAVQIKNVKSVAFTPLSAVCIQINLVLSYDNTEVPIDVTIQLKNSGLVYQQ